MSSLILLIPILSAFITGLIGRYIGVTGSQYVAVGLILISLLATLITIVELLLGYNIQYISVLSFINTSILKADWGILVDSLSLSLIFPVVLISFCVHLYSVNYIAHDPHHQRFLSYLSLFTASMLVLVSSPSLLQLFIGWELIGLSSYLLISFWYTRLPASKSALQAFIINRLGDVALSIAIYLIFCNYNSLNFTSLLTLSSEIKNYNLLTLALLIAAIAKSAQFGLQTWLPSAMEGPTPVSALIHAATLVTAGAFLLLRLSPILDNSNIIILITGLIGSITAVFAGTIGLVQNDLKRIIAFSTCSQIGYLFIAIGAGQYNIALFHIINHAIFKALLFLGAGAVIHSINNLQDIRRIGGLIYFIPLAYLSLLIGSLSLIAMPFLTGFYSKELIIELNYIQFTFVPILIYFLATLAACLTGYYSIRLIYITFYSSAQGRPSTYYNIHNLDLILAIPLVLLLFISVIIGFIFKDIYTGVGSSLLAGVLPLNSIMTEVEFNISSLIKIIPLFLTLTAGTIALFSYLSPSFNTNYTIFSLYSFLSIKWGLDHLINRLAFLILNVGFIISKVVDRGLIEIVGPYGLSWLLINISNTLTNSYNLSRYCAIIVLTLLLTLIFF